MSLRTIFAKLWLCGALALANIAYATSVEQGVSIGNNTRAFIYSDESAVSLNVSNYTNKHYLVFSRVLKSPSDEQLSDGFVFAPELMELGPQKSSAIVIQRMSHAFPSDRESLQYVNVTMIPDSKEAVAFEKGVVDYVISVTQKLFIRPSHLRQSDAVEVSQAKLEFEVRSKKLKIKNPTPFYLTFHRLDLDGRQVALVGNNQMIAPYSSIELEILDTPNKVSWSLIRDSGFPTESLTRKLTHLKVDHD